MYEKELIGVVRWESMGMIWRGLVLEVHWVCSGGNRRVWSSGCVLEGISQCGPAGVNMHCLNRINGCGPVGVVCKKQWMCSGGNQKVLSSGRVLEGIRG